MKRIHWAAPVALMMLLLPPTPSLAAIFITDMDVSVIEFREGGAVTGWGFGTNVHGSGLLSGTVTPAGMTAHNLTTEGAPTTLDIDSDDELFSTLAMLEGVYPDNVSYSYTINGTDGYTLTFSIYVDLPEFPMGFPSITNPDHLASGVPLNTVLEWECTGCDGHYIEADTESLPDDDILDFEGIYAVGSGSHDPGTLEPGTSYESEVELITKTFVEDALDLGVNGLVDLSLGRAVVDTHIYSTASVVPVPAAVWLFGSGLVGLIGYSKRKKAA